LLASSSGRFFYTFIWKPLPFSLLLECLWLLYCCCYYYSTLLTHCCCCFLFGQLCVYFKTISNWKS
jgi:hypothetical protein